MADALAQFSQMLGRLGTAGIGMALAAVPVAAAAAVYITRMGSQAKIDRLENDIHLAEQRVAEDQAAATGRFAELEGRYQALLRTGPLIQAQIDAVEGVAADIASHIDAADFSVLVPAPTSIPGDMPSHLVFLCASGPQALKLKWVRVPIAKSLSGQVYSSGKASIVRPTASGSTFASRTDQALGYNTEEALSVCLRFRNQPVGVAQFLNKRSGTFSSIDVDRAIEQCSMLAIRVGEFVADPRRLIELGHAPRQNEYPAAILSVDLTGFHLLFSRMDNSSITDLLNQYFQELCSVAVAHGGTIDQVIGDGMLLVFNGRPSDEIGHHALTAALAMRARFRSLRGEWAALGYPGAAGLFVRLGLSTGPVTRVELGYVQNRRLTVIGPAVNEAAHACDAGPRDRDTICLSPGLKDAIENGAEWRFTAIGGAKGEVFELNTSS
jgi:class 3 adenylate cyclase